MSRIRETKITLPCSREQKQELEHKAKALGMSVANYLRSVLGFPLEQQGHRKDLSDSTAKAAVQNDVQEASQENIEHTMIVRNED